MAKGNELKAKPSKKILVVPEELFHKIEESRGDLSRDEFINLCLDTLIEEESKAEIRPPEKKPIPQKPPVTPPSGETPSEVQSPIIFGLSPNIFVQPGEIFAPTKPEKKIEEELSLTFLWSIALALYGFGDTFSSVLVFTKGGVEANPILATLLGWFGGSIAAFILIKMLILLGLLFLSYLAPKQGWIIPLLLILTGSFLTTYNLLHYFLILS